MSKTQDSFIEQVQRSKSGSDPNETLALYETPLVTADIVIFTIHDNALKVLLIQRKRPPFAHMWAIPGGFIRVGETLAEAAERRLYEETNVKNIYLEQLYCFGKPDRDPRSRIITVAYYALIRSDKSVIKADANAEDVQWFEVNKITELAFDHKDIVLYALGRLKERIKTSNISFQLLPEKFTLTELQRVYELILDKNLDKRNFRKKILATHILVETDETKMEGYHRPAQLYSFRERGKIQLYDV